MTELIWRGRPIDAVFDLLLTCKTVSHVRDLANSRQKLHRANVGQPTMRRDTL